VRRRARLSGSADADDRDERRRGDERLNLGDNLLASEKRR
jgi:hypothetical protein